MIRPFTLQEAAGRTQGRVVPVSAGPVCFRGVSTDTRTLAEGDLFVALRGERFDGHGFLEAAARAGAVAALVDTAEAPSGLPRIQVSDTLLGLGALARQNREESAACLVGVTGSSGKTTVKEMLAAILANEGATLATTGNLNNHIGVPLTLFGLTPEHRYAVIEMGASGLGEIAYTAGLARPRVALITNAGEAHLEGFGSYENIVQAKGEIIDGLPADGTLVLNADDPACPRWQARAGSRQVLTVSARGKPADLRCVNVRKSDGGHEIDVAGADGLTATLVVALPGEHNIGNALLAMAAAMAAGAGLASVRRGLAEVKAAQGRLEVSHLSPRLTLIDDSYNANPTSMEAALGVLAEAGGTRVAVLGPMAELGGDSRRLHEAVGKAARTLGIDRLLVVGDERCQGYRDGFGSATEWFESHEQAVSRLMSDNAESLTVLVKGSRSSAMNLVAEALKEKVKNPCCSG